MHSNSFGLKPFGNQVVIKPEIEEVTASGLIMLANSETKPTQGVVVAVGPGTQEKPLTVQTGTVVMFRKYGGTEFEMDGQTYLVLREEDLIGEITQ